MITKVNIDIQNLPKTLDGNYIVVRYFDSKVWFYGCFSSKEKAQSAINELPNAFAVEIDN